MAFEASRKFFFIGYRAVKGTDDEYGIYLKEIPEKGSALTSFYKSDLHETFLENKYEAMGGLGDINESGRMSFKKDGNRRVEINGMEIIFPDAKLDETAGNYDLDFHVRIEGTYSMRFDPGKIMEGYKMLDALGEEIRDIFTNKLSKKTQIPMTDRE